MLQRISHTLEQPRMIAILIVLVAALSAVGIVFAQDSATTSVTVGNSAPVITSMNLNTGSNIALVESSFVYATTTFTVTDANGCGTLTAPEVRLYRSDGATDGTTCAADDNDCYDEFGVCIEGADTCTGGADTAVDYECGFRLWYIADATDAAPFLADIWTVAATSTDGTDTTVATNSTQTIEVSSLLAMDVTAAIAYGTLGASTDSGTTDQIATTTNTGNRILDSQIGGDNMCLGAYDAGCVAPDLAPGQQAFDLTAGVTQGSKTNTLVASLTPATIDVDLPKPTATTTAVEDPTYWGIAIPGGQTNGTYNGQNDFTAVAG